jgi:hypothetical protein
LSDVEGEVSTKRKLKVYPIGCFTIDITEVRKAEGKLYMFGTSDRTSKSAFVARHEKATTRNTDSARAEKGGDASSLSTAIRCLASRCAVVTLPMQH